MSLTKVDRVREFRRMLCAIKGVLVACAATSVAAEDSDKGKESWDGSIEFSASSATGNTENSVLGARFDARRVIGRYTHDIGAGANFAETTKTDDMGEKVSETTQNNWYAQYRMELQVSDRTYGYARARYDQDEFSGFENRVFVGGGIGHTAIEREDMTWNLRAGPGVQYTMLEEPEPPVPDDFEDSVTELAVYAGSEFDWTIRENVNFEHDLDVTWTEENTTIATVAGIKTKLTESLSSRLSYQVKHETDPPEGREDTDTLLRASVVYGF